MQLKTELKINLLLNKPVNGLYYSLIEDVTEKVNYI